MAVAPPASPTAAGLAASVRVRALNFGAWFPLDDASGAAPELPGVLQARAEAALAYPRGKSAMLLYARSQADETLRHYLAAGGAAPIGRARSSGAKNSTDCCGNSSNGSGRRPRRTGRPTTSPTAKI